MDSVTISLIAVTVWFLVSIIWSESTYSVFEFFLWCSYFLLFTAARKVSTEFVMYLLLPVGIFLSLAQFHLQYKYRDKYLHKAWKRFPVFGNSNHNAAFLCLTFYAALWLALNVSNYFYAASAIIGAAVLQTKCRGGIAGLILSVILFMSIIEPEILIYSAVLFLVFGVLNIGKIINGSYRDRIVIYRDAIKRIHPRWLTGRGLNYFRELKYGRVHNDILEIIGETGLVGLALLVALFAQISFTPVILCCLVCFLIHGMVFFPLREVHTAAPFWAIMGSAATPVYNNSMWILKGVSVLAIVFVLIFIFTVFTNLVNHKG